MLPNLATKGKDILKPIDLIQILRGQQNIRMLKYGSC